MGVLEICSREKHSLLCQWPHRGSREVVKERTPGLGIWRAPW